MTTAVKLDRAHCIDTIVRSSALRSFEMDKAAESALLQAFNSLVPRGTYLADYLEGAVEEFERAVQVDMVMPCYHRVQFARQELADAKKELAEIKAQFKAEEVKLRAVRRDVDYAKRQAAELSESIKEIDDAMSAIRRVAREVNSKS